MFEVSDVMVDKEEIAMILKIGMDLPEKPDKKSAPFGVSENDFSVSNPYTEAVLQKWEKSLRYKASLFFLPAYPV